MHDLSSVLLLAFFWSAVLVGIASIAHEVYLLRFDEKEDQPELGFRLS